MKSSLGFHTMLLSRFLSSSTTKELIEDFKKYGKSTEKIKMYHNENKELEIKFCRQYFGIEWKIAFNVWIESNKAFSDILEVKINPKILAGIHDFLTASTLDDMNVAMVNFNWISGSISQLLGVFDHYKIKRIDYCVNFDLSELAPGCTCEQMMKLIKRAGVPYRYSEWEEYDEKAHRTKSRNSSFYLINGSVNINCYSKYMKLQEQNIENKKRGFPPVSQEYMLASTNIIRFEVQCKKRKAYMIYKKTVKQGEMYIYEQMLGRMGCANVIGHYYKKTIGYGDWYTFDEAVRKIKSCHYNAQKETRLIHALKMVREYHSIPKAKEVYDSQNLDAFNRALNDLALIHINPVTIPKDWGIKHIPNLLLTYNEKELEEWLNLYQFEKAFNNID